MKSIASPGAARNANVDREAGKIAREIFRNKHSMNSIVGRFRFSIPRDALMSRHPLKY